MEAIRKRINSLRKRMNILDKYVKNENNSLTCDAWQRYFKLTNTCSSEYSKLIRL